MRSLAARRLRFLESLSGSESVNDAEIFSAIKNIAKLRRIPRLEEELKKAKAEIKRLEERVSFWNKAWHSQHETTGQAAWQVPHPLYLKGATESHFFQREFKKFIEYAQLLDKMGLLNPSAEGLDTQEKDANISAYVDPFENNS